MSFKRVMNVPAWMWAILLIGIVASQAPAPSAEAQDGTTATSVQTENTTSTTSTEDTVPTTAASAVSNDDRRTPPVPVSEFKSATTNDQSPSGSWTSGWLCGLNSTPNPWCTHVTDSFTLNVAAAGTLTGEIIARHWNSGPDGDEAFTVTSPVFNGDLNAHKEDTASTTFNLVVTEATALPFSFDHSGYPSGSVQAIVKWTFTPAPAPIARSVNITGNGDCSGFNTQATASHDGATLSYDPAPNGAWNGNASITVTVKATWSDGTSATNSTQINAPDAATCNPPTPMCPHNASLPLGDPGCVPPPTKTTCPNGVVTFTGECPHEVPPTDG